MGFIQSNHSVILYNNTMISYNFLEACRQAKVQRCVAFFGGGLAGFGVWVGQRGHFWKRGLGWRVGSASAGTKPVHSRQDARLIPTPSDPF